MKIKCSMKIKLTKKQTVELCEALWAYAAHLSPSSNVKAIDDWRTRVLDLRDIIRSEMLDQLGTPKTPKL